MASYKTGVETRASLYRSAQQNFYSKGFYHTSVKDIVTTADSKLGLFTYYFESKDALATDILIQCLVAGQTALNCCLADLPSLTSRQLYMMHKRFCAACLTATPQIAHFFSDVSTTPLFMQLCRRRQPDSPWALQADIQQLAPGNYSNEELIVSFIVGIGVQFFRDLCDGHLTGPTQDMVDLFLLHAFSMFQSHDVTLKADIDLTHRLFQDLDICVTEGFAVSVSWK